MLSSWPHGRMDSADPSRVTEAGIMRPENFLLYRDQFLGVSGLHRSELAEAVVAAEAGEQRDGGVDHADGLGDHDRAAAEAGEPVPPAGVVALDPVGLLLADEQPPLRDQLGVGLPAIGAMETDPPALQAFQHSFEGGGITTAQLPVDEPTRSTIPSLPDPELVRL